MQKPAERYLVQKLAAFLNSRETDPGVQQILNAGAGQSTSIEQQLTQAGCKYVCDRLDIENCDVDFPTVRECWQCSIEDMKPVDSGRYVAVFSNYVLEHIENLRWASQSIYRVLAPGGVFVATVPNTLAPEFILARHTSLWFHKLLRQGHAWETRYAYHSIPALLNFFLAAGFQVEDVRYWPFVEQYLWRYPVAGRLGKLYDRLISIVGYRRFMGDVCFMINKPS